MSSAGNSYLGNVGMKYKELLGGEGLSILLHNSHFKLS